MKATKWIKFIAAAQLLKTGVSQKQKSIRVETSFV